MAKCNCVVPLVWRLLLNLIAKKITYAVGIVGPKSIEGNRRSERRWRFLFDFLDFVHLGSHAAYELSPLWTFGLYESTTTKRTASLQPNEIIEKALHKIIQEYLYLSVLVGLRVDS